MKLIITIRDTVIKVLGLLSFIAPASQAPVSQALANAGIAAALLQEEPAPKAGPDAAFIKLYSEEWRFRQGLSGGSEGARSDHIPANLPNISEEMQVSYLNYWQGIKARLQQIDIKALTPENQLNYRIFDYQITSFIAAQTFKEYQRPVNSDSSFWSELTSSADQTLRSEQDAEDYLNWLSQVPRYIDQNIEHMKQGLKRGFTPPQVTLKGRERAITLEATQKDPEKSTFYKPFISLPATISAENQKALRYKAKKLILEKITPSYQKLSVFFIDTYVKRAQTKLGATELPDGEAYYASKIYEFTTLTLTPDEIHQTGLSEVAKIKSEMIEVMKDVGFTGSLSEFLTFLRTDPQFYAKTPTELLYKAAWVAKKFDAVAAKYFKTLPRARFAIVPVPDAIAPYYTAGRGGPTTYWLNTYDLPSRALYSLPALTLHESAPGHSFQLSLSQENTQLPPFRAKTYISAYGEGWALYSERLGVEMGIYETSYEKFGMLSYQMWRAARLVVDTGIHAKGWTREEAISFMRDNTALSEHEINTEIDRYISWPGQALSYYLGMLEIERLRAKAQSELKDKFDIRTFHDVILATGSVPLTVLSDRIDTYIKEAN